MERFDKSLTIIVTAHNEGAIAEMTMRNLARAVDELKRVKVDFLINIDKGDARTKKVFLDFKKKLGAKDDIKIRETNYGDPGLARNAAIRAARGDYIMMIDADDMVSLNWLVVAMERLEREGALAVIHPEAEFRYNDEKGDSLHMRVDDMGDFRTTFFLLEGNRWCSIALAKREVFQNHRYSESNEDYGYEDYYFNCELTKDGVRHLVARGTTCFLLQKRSSVTSETHSRNKILPRTGLFDLTRLKELGTEKGASVTHEAEKMTPRSVSGVPDFVVVQAEEVGGGKLKAKIRDLPNWAVIWDGENGAQFGAKFCKMLEGAELKDGARVMAFIGNIVEYLEMKKRYGDDIFIILTHDVEYLAGRKFLKTQGLATMIESWQKTALTLLMAQSGVDTVVLNGDALVKKWGEEYLGLETVKIVIW